MRVASESVRDSDVIHSVPTVKTVAGASDARVALILLPIEPGASLLSSHARACEVRHEEATGNYEKLEANVVDDSHDALHRAGQRIRRRTEGQTTAAAEGETARRHRRSEA